LLKRNGSKKITGEKARKRESPSMWKRKYRIHCFFHFLPPSSSIDCEPSEKMSLLKNVAGNTTTRNMDGARYKAEF
jgi:hypothetical protein